MPGRVRFGRAYSTEETSMAGPGDRRRHPLTAVEGWLDGADRAIYIMVASLFLAAAIAMGVYAIITFIEHIQEDFLLQLIASINDLLLVLIILEVFGTVRSYLSNGTTSVKPFLYIGIISATRRILAIGAQTTIGEVASEAAFRRLMIDLGVNGAVVLALALAVFLFSRGQPAAE
jgi:uncharacterized membrane protein (DUF373 family)